MSKKIFQYQDHDIVFEFSDGNKMINATQMAKPFKKLVGHFLALKGTKDYTSKPKPKGQVGIVRDIELKTNGVEGMVIIKCKRDSNATTYKARVSTDQQNWFWVNASSTRTVKVHKVPIGVPIFVQMQLENAHGFSPWSDSVSGLIPTQNVISSIHK